MRFRVAGVEVEVDVMNDGQNGEALGAELLARWEGYAPAGTEPDIVVRYDAVPGFAAPQPASREYPGFGAEPHGPGAFHLQRRDARGVIRVPAAGPVIADFVGLDRPFSLEACLRVVMSTALPRVGGLMLHSAGVAGPSRALLFLGPSGAGKSTIARLLGLRRLGDDLTVVRPDAGGFRAHATPFAGELGPAPDGSAPLSGLYFIQQASGHHLMPLPAHHAVRRLLRNTMAYVVEAETAARVLAAAAALVAAVPCYVLEFAKDAGVAAVLGVT